MVKGSTGNVLQAVNRRRIAPVEIVEQERDRCIPRDGGQELGHGSKYKHLLVA